LNWIVGVELSFLKEGFEVVVGVLFVLLVINFGLVLSELLPSLVVECLLNSKLSMSHRLVLLRDGAILIPDGLVALLLLG
jgi:hypothetical protein